MLQGHLLDINGRPLSPFMVGDSAYPLHSWLVKPYPRNSSLSSQQKTYNYRMSRACIVSENAFVQLKASWCRLAKQNDMDVKRVPYVVDACCILHNICVITGY
uniref:DDE Tnp4 domain-containing protein n=1 Tax=Amphimedon queenslandica TaxID=400682 RepID=A0A1X7V8N4_AMPQE